MLCTRALLRSQGSIDRDSPPLKTWRHAVSDRPSMVVKTPLIAQPVAKPKADNHVLGVFVGLTGAGERRQHHQLI